MEEEDCKKRPLVIDWTKMLEDDDGEPPALVVVKNTEDPPQPSPMVSQREDVAFLSDQQLEDAIKRQKSNYSKIRLALPDRGQKILATVKAFEEERVRRKFQSHQMDVDENNKSTQSTCRSSVDGSNYNNVVLQVDSQSSFATNFNTRMEGNTDCKVVKAFNEELSTLNHHNHQKIRSYGGSPRGTQKGRSSRQWPFQSVSSLHNGDKPRLLKSDQRCKSSSLGLLRHNGKDLSYGFPKKEEDVASLNGSVHNKGQTVVLLEEDEVQAVEAIEQESKHAECRKVAKIYYPSRDDPESIEISHADINCLGPEGYLTSPIMNFYIRYLWLNASPAKRATCDYHIFNTFFYEKLKQAVTYKGVDKVSTFAKFRRWWRGVDLFQKAYVLIPIHEDLHWSLVIICIPDKEDESGPIILHLDSLGLHASRSVFDNIKSYLKDEWNYLNRESATYDHPISDKIWNDLPGRINQKKIDVPQQKNDYDCGLFVLFFMERFIEEAPERLKKRDLTMFCKQWFRPEEASSLRVKIRKLLLEKFQNASEGDPTIESVAQSSDGGSP
ncbi:hypothetical protein K2173_008302 [Erythroxylum novogranatense]|uniref:Ubiquitin-like protease family profile domain-containing protein n=1 Tax=Erythroxylum novogranatense TaxID=1862640 RepID=A0AAV8U6K7_9ROSI|nr:hypothetical protein K2173_008302 [Erythroxylum novogranatense]